MLLARYQAEQAAIGQQVTRVIRNLWDQHIMPDQFSASWFDISPLMKQIVMQHYRASAASAVRFYRLMHYAEGLPPIAVRPSAADFARIDRTAGAVANGTFYHQLNKQKREPADASVIARNTMSGSASRLALMGGRNTVMEMVSRDPQAVGWERILGYMQSACSFCTMHAARGPYRVGMMDFHPHDYCHCVARPLFRNQRPVNADLASEWRKATRGTSGSGVEARAAWEEYRRSDGGNQDTTGRNVSGQAAPAVPGQGDAG